eukprot:CAMPEP_0198153264 /NCGR_PEP_ID=MMETSP1443-20131203/63361_1 /TAXON_ID=186043 /ORGANISM="Entomoneis sp., Strain CCMP2396" /LENGTH=47 /DNA_ID= /DNA_START= /DNA_END= /DNA_ORIENTATION=
MCQLTQPVKDDLKWWKPLFSKDGGQPARAKRSATLVPTYGDGSGSGT